MRKILALILMFLGSNSLGGSLLELEVFTTSARAIKELSEHDNRGRSYHLTIYDMNRVEEWEKEVSAGLSGDEETARAQVDSRIEAMGGKTVFESQVLEAYSPLMRAVELGLNEYPSVVINEQFVVYGTDSAEAAIERYRTWERSAQ